MENLLFGRKELNYEDLLVDRNDHPETPLDAEEIPEIREEEMKEQARIRFIELIKTGELLAELEKIMPPAECKKAAHVLSSADIGPKVKFVLLKAELVSFIVPLMEKPDPENAFAWYIKGAALADLEKHEEAIACYDTAIRMDPRNAEVWNSEGVSLEILGRYEQAVKCHDKAIEINPRNADAWSNKGVALMGLKKYKEAVECYDRATEIDPKFTEAWGGKGLALGHLGRYRDAIKCEDKALEICPTLEPAKRVKETCMKKLIAELVEVLNHKDKDVRYRAAEVLGMIGSDAKGAVPALIETLKDRDKKMRSHAAQALGNISPAAIPALHRVSEEDKDEGVRRHAREAVVKLLITDAKGKKESSGRLGAVLNAIAEQDEVQREAAEIQKMTRKGVIGIVSTLVKNLLKENL